MIGPFDGTMPDAQTSVGILDRLVDRWESRPGVVELPLASATLMTSVGIEIQADHAVQVSKSAQLLASKGMLIQIAPMSRMAIECGVTAAWWSLNPAGVRGSVAEHDSHRANMLNRLLTPNAAQPSQAQLDARRERSRHASSEARNFADRCAALAGGRALYPFYQLLSEASHGGASLFNEYLEEVPITESNPVGVQFRSAAEYGGVDVALGMNVVGLALAMRARDDFSSTHADRHFLDAVADELGLGLTIQSAS